MPVSLMYPKSRCVANSRSSTKTRHHTRPTSVTRSTVHVDRVVFWWAFITTFDIRQDNCAARMGLTVDHHYSGGGACVCSKKSKQTPKPVYHLCPHTIFCSDRYMFSRDNELSA